LNPGHDTAWLFLR